MPFGLGPTELIIILGIALLLFGAKRLPEIGSSLGNAIKEFRKTQSDDSNSEKKSIPSSDKKEYEYQISLFPLFIIQTSKNPISYKRIIGIATRV